MILPVYLRLALFVAFDWPIVNNTSVLSVRWAFDFLLTTVGGERMIGVFHFAIRTTVGFQYLMQGVQFMDRPKIV